MSDKNTQLGIEIAGSSLALGVVGKALLSASPWGAGAFIWFSALCMAGYGLSRRWRNLADRRESAVVVLLVLLAALFVWRDAAMLKISTAVALCVGLAVGVQRAQQQFISLESISEKWVRLLSMSFKAFRGFPLYFAQVLQKTAGSHVDKETARSIARGLVMALPCLVIFGLLLAMADEGFARWFTDSLFVDLSHLPGTLFFTLLFTWLAGSYLRGLLTRLSGKSLEENESRLLWRIGLMEAGIVLGLVDLLFGAFVVFQLGYLFGGAAFIQEVSGLTLSEYARRGFFEMLAVSVLALPVLLGLNRFFRPAGAAQKASFNALAGVQIGLLLIMLISAGQRMALYIDAYGWTELRLYASSFMAWMIFALGWFGWTVLRGNIGRFSTGAVLAGLIVILGLNVANPDAVIVRSNIARVADGKSFDPTYAANLSADAVPALIEALTVLPTRERRQVADMLMDRWVADDNDAWTAWNGSRYRARKAVSAAAGRLSEYAATGGH